MQSPEATQKGFSGYFLNWNHNNLLNGAKMAQVK